MALPGIRIGDPVNCGDNSGQGSDNVFFNGIPVTRLNDLTTGHCFTPSPFVDGSPTVFVNDRPAVRVNDPIAIHCCGIVCHSGNAAVGSPNVFIGSGSASTVIQDVEVNMQPGTPRVIYGENITCDEFPEPINTQYNNIVQAAEPAPYNEKIVEETENKSTPKPDVPTDCSDIEAHTGPFPGSFQLSPNFTLSQLTTNTLVSNYSLRAQVGLTEKQIVCNLRILCLNVLEPLRAAYGSSMRINSAFRHGTGRSQHNRGQAVDVSFTDTPTTDTSYERAKECMNNFNYDQYIYEQNRTLWHHFSYSSSGNRRQVMSKPRGNRFYQGLKKIVI